MISFLLFLLKLYLLINVTNEFHICLKLLRKTCKYNNLEKSRFKLVFHDASIRFFCYSLQDDNTSQCQLRLLLHQVEQYSTYY